MAHQATMTIQEEMIAMAIKVTRDHHFAQRGNGRPREIVLGGLVNVKMRLESVQMLVGEHQTYLNG
jgi:hypothetical protein